MSKLEECKKAGKVCETCAEKETCDSAEKLLAPPHKLSHVKHLIAVMSGKGGVGKSSVSALLSTTFARRGYRIGILDADVTGPSIPKLFGLKEHVEGSEFGIYVPKTSHLGIYVMSMNLFLPHEDDPVIWRGPLLANVIKQFWSDVAWGKLDYLIVDLPPGTGDVPLTVMQSLPLEGVIIVSSPQELAVMVVKKAIHMTEMMKIPILGLIENMTYVRCPKCGEKIFSFGEPQGEEVARQTGIQLLASLPVDPKLSRLGDAGRIEEYEPTGLEDLPQIFEKRFASSSKTARMLFRK
ncbi:MAG TPA: ATP-binding protein [Desulfotomaculum sp.]|nr:ATP-binding protein [Desulfotomaculum sp.]